ncbi:DUF4231 domain-containing protein [Mycoplasma marinum]|uniref:DUF4231 domain-containing protein n=1 Tax=Mycoplasma marinum TaxID=1937190 RepID=A0A4R0XS22_9MOLU|nr:DUF4231 domain-containing protein [Mycoplasma marinum]TCG11220.1 hypothetical protein C4B24_02565 [Mycoplasma marinum]
MNKISIYALHSNPIEYVNSRKNKAKKEMIIFRIIFIILNLTVALAAASIAILTALVFSLLLYGGKKPTWFFFTTTGVSAITVMVTSFVNFFVIKGRYQQAKDIYKKILGQVTLFINNAGLYEEGVKNREMILYTRVAQIYGNHDAIGEISDELKQLETNIKKTKKGTK